MELSIICVLSIDYLLLFHAISPINQTYLTSLSFMFICPLLSFFLHQSLQFTVYLYHGCVQPQSSLSLISRQPFDSFECQLHISLSFYLAQMEWTSGSLIVMCLCLARTQLPTIWISCECNAMHPCQLNYFVWLYSQSRVGASSHHRRVLTPSSSCSYALSASWCALDHQRTHQ
jgi:hypothetical protein